MKNLPITRNNVLKYMPCSESRLFQVFVPKGLTDKKKDKYTEILLRVVSTLKRRHQITESIKYVETETKDGEKKQTKMVSFAMNGQTHHG